jgi:hypothetical protein
MGLAPSGRDRCSRGIVADLKEETGGRDRPKGAAGSVGR